MKVYAISAKRFYTDGFANTLEVKLHPKEFILGESLNTTNQG